MCGCHLYWWLAPALVVSGLLLLTPAMLTCTLISTYRIVNIRNYFYRVCSAGVCAAPPA